MNILVVLLVFGVLVGIHEFGHFLMAKREGFKVEKFSIGFGPSIYNFKYKETMFSIGIIPFGGYVKVTGLFEEESGTIFGSPFSRLKVLLGGSAMNLILSIILFTIILMSGDPAQPTTTIRGLVPGLPAEAVGIKIGDRVVAVNGIEIKKWEELVSVINNNPQKEITLSIIRNSQRLEIPVVPELDKGRGVGIIGVFPEFARTPILHSLYYGVIRTFSASISIIQAIFFFVIGERALDLIGPVGVAQVVSRAYGAGILYLLFITALLSANLATVNLLPIPALDGGHAIVLIYEMIFKKRPQAKILGLINFIGFALLMLFLILLSFREIRDLF
ncbi:MAG: Regulator of sigma-W protease RasP [candidate division WS2 bacterium]|uniref:Zinc metalloprotease n=1 Tax=Psychracetigena formicireducens TaxID=2986056 RepID=A0A9E2BF08_PSYF1|nr:Regulator of sigma-W protease RasP [Candidatus Psychracetigena formicireducens]MBT9144302.1 Regulator of sigma-W protease RasP [Candidatus Psychracetigena formicireducens]